MYFQNIPYEPDSPKVEYKEGVLTLSGKAIPSDADFVWFPILQDFKNYALSGQPLTVIFKFDYYNTASARYLSTMFKIMNEMHLLNKNIDVYWYYYDIDETMKELGEMYQEIVKFKINFKEVEYGK